MHEIIRRASEAVQRYNVECIWREGIGEFWTSMPSVLILGGNVCSCLVYIFLVDVIQRHVLMINTHVAQTGDEEDI